MSIKGKIYRTLFNSIESIPYFHFIKNTKATQTPINFRNWAIQKLLRINHGPYWPVHSSSTVGNWQSIRIGIETSPGLMPGCYIQGLGGISIGDYTQIAANVGIISANHKLTDNRAHVKKSVEIGSYCWLGFGATILPGVTLGDFTIVGAGAIVTKSFPEGYAVIAGNPAKLIKRIPVTDCNRHKSNHEYHGYIHHKDFLAFEKKHLSNPQHLENKGSN